LKGVFDRKPTQADIISIFKEKSQWHLTYSKIFPKVHAYPLMMSWLEEDQSDKVSDVKLWGVLKPDYTFSDLAEWLANRGEGLNTTGTEMDSGSSQKKSKEVEEKRKGKERERQGKSKGERK
jgi:phage terminase large subunit-like protein